MEYADGGDLYGKICEHTKRNTHFPEEEIWTIFIQTVWGLKALHDHNILHRDLKVLFGRSVERERVLDERWQGQARRLERVQNRQKRLAPDTDRHPVLRES